MGEFIDKFMNDMDKYFTAVGIKTGELAGVAKIKLEIHYLNKEKNETLQEMGNMMYKMFQRESFNQEKIIEKCRIIADIDERIKIKEDEADKVHENARRSKKRNHKNKRRKHDKKVVETESYEIMPLE